MNKMLLTGILTAVAAISIPANGWAQASGEFSIRWSAVVPAGGKAIGGAYTLDTAVGQPAAGPTLAAVGGPYTLSGGFWTGAPQVRPALSIALSGHNVVVRWPAASSAGFHLQHCTDLSRTNWLDNMSPVMSIGSDKAVIEPTVAHRVYRLVQP